MDQPIEWTPEQAKQIIETIKHRGVSGNCPMCGRAGEFVLMSGYFNAQLYSRTGVFTVPSGAMPIVALICGHCGFISQHAMGAIDLLSVWEGAAKR